jgi:hypothetical protein
VRKAHENAQPKTWKPNDGGGPTKTHKHRVLKVSFFFFFLENRKNQLSSEKKRSRAPSFSGGKKQPLYMGRAMSEKQSIVIFSPQNCEVVVLFSK